jgi:CheY-like chemotaxis protein
MRETRTILLVDSSASSLFFWRMLLKRLEYKVVAVRNAEEALRTMETTVPDAVLTDSSLPGMSGAELLAAMKITPRLKDVPVIILTAAEDRQEKEKCKRLGCAGWFTKDVEPDVLYRTLQAVSETGPHQPRQFIRLSTSLRAVVGDGTTIGGSRRTESVTAISEGGLFIRTRYPQPRNTITPVRIDLGGVEISAKAVVLYSSSGNENPAGEPGMGMRFVEMSDHDRGLLRRFVKDQITKGIAH